MSTVKHGESLHQFLCYSLYFYVQLVHFFLVVWTWTLVEKDRSIREGKLRNMRRRLIETQEKNGNWNKPTVKLIKLHNSSYWKEKSSEVKQSVYPNGHSLFYRNEN